MPHLETILSLLQRIFGGILAINGDVVKSREHAHLPSRSTPATELLLRGAVDDAHLLREFSQASSATSRLLFDAKVSLALVLGLSADLKRALNAANNLRNDFAHKLDRASEKRE
jgi:hypothetical protein